MGQSKAKSPQTNGICERLHRSITSANDMTDASVRAISTAQSVER